MAYQPKNANLIIGVGVFLFVYLFEKPVLTLLKLPIYEKGCQNMKTSVL
jgi:hypothetical protein